MRHLSIHSLRALTLLGLILLLGACVDAPDQQRVETVLIDRLNGAFNADTFEVTVLRRLGSTPLGAAEDGSPRRIVYFNSILTFARDLDFSSWETLNIAAFANLLGATEQGIEGLKQDGNHTGDQIRVRGSASFILKEGDWVAVDAVHPAVGSATGSVVLGGASDSKQRIERINALMQRETGHPKEQQRIISEELNSAYENITVRLDRLDRALIIAGGQPGGEYGGIASLLAADLTQNGTPSTTLISNGSAENIALMRARKADVALLQNNVASQAQIGTGPFSEVGPFYDLQALASLFPEPIHVIVAKDSPIQNLTDLVGKRVEIGQPNSGSRYNAITLLRTAGIELGALEAIQETGLQEGLEQLNAGALDAVIATIGAPSKAIQRAAALGGIRLLTLTQAQRDAMTQQGAEFLPVTLPPLTYPGQHTPLPTVAVTALIVGTAGLPGKDVKRILTALFERIDFVHAGSAAGSLITRNTAEVGLTIPMHPAAISFFDQAAPNTPDADTTPESQ